MKRRPEEAIHRAIAEFLRVSLPPPWLFYHVPNGGARSKAEAGAFKAMGVKAGMPDLIVVGPHLACDATKMLALEVKAPKGRLSLAQNDAIAALAKCGIPTRVVRSIDEAEEALRELSVPLRIFPSRSHHGRHTAASNRRATRVKSANT